MMLGGSDSSTSYLTPSITLVRLFPFSRTIYLLLPKDARRHVNKMCMAAEIPLVESGTAGYLGQVQPLLKVSGYELSARISLNISLAIGCH